MKIYGQFPEEQPKARDLGSDHQASAVDVPAKQQERFWMLVFLDERECSKSNFWRSSLCQRLTVKSHHFYTV